MRSKETKEWPIIMETTDPRKRTEGARRYTIQDARNTWEVKISPSNAVNSTIVEIVGFSDFYFLFVDPTDNGEKVLRCFKLKPVRVSDSGEIANYQDRFNLIDDEGNRKTLRLTNFKKYLEKIV